MSTLLVTGNESGTVVTLTMNRPDRRNTLALEVMRELTAAVHEAVAGGARGLVIAANGPVFSAGHDFGDLAGADVDTAIELFEVCTTMMRAIQAAPIPVCARVHALATAAGCQLVAACDLAVAAQSAGFAIPGGKGGLFCHTPLVAVARNIGRKRALELAFTGDSIDAATAAEWGLINKAVPDDELDLAVADLMERSVRGSARSKALGKRTFYEQIDLAQDLAYELAIDVMGNAAAGPEAQEGIAAFLGKRRPTFD